MRLDERRLLKFLKQKTDKSRTNLHFVVWHADCLIWLLEWVKFLSLISRSYCLYFTHSSFLPTPGFPVWRKDKANTQPSQGSHWVVSFFYARSTARQVQRQNKWHQPQHCAANSTGLPGLFLQHRPGDLSCIVFQSFPSLRASVRQGDSSRNTVTIGWARFHKSVFLRGLRKT